MGDIEPSIDHIPQTSINGLATQKMIYEFNQLLETFKSQVTQD